MSFEDCPATTEALTRKSLMMGDSILKERFLCRQADSVLGEFLGKSDPAPIFSRIHSLLPIYFYLAYESR
jgi:hypothetical protein